MSDGSREVASGAGASGAGTSGSSDYAALLGRLVAARRFGVDLGLERMARLLAALGHPERHLGAVVHVGGTNGKGSTVAMIAAIARAAGRRVATYTSPHLSSLRERVMFDEGAVGEAEFVDAAAAVSAAGGDELTFFEQVTAIGLLAIARRGVDVSVIEVGLGGRLDATNVIDAPVAVVTGVAMDHEAVLGTTLAAIAGEKAGIFKRGRGVVIGASGQPEAVAGLRARAEAARARRVTVVDAARIAAVPPVALVGAHQRANAAAAIAALELLAEAPTLVDDEDDDDEIDGLDVRPDLDGASASASDDEPQVRLDDPAAIARGLATVVHPGRFEILEAGAIILDGAHNPHGAAALAAALRDRGERPQLVVACSADKDVGALLAAIAPACARVIATRFQQDRALAPEALAARAAEVTTLPVEHAPDLAAALALAGAHSERPICIAGSLFLVGEARTLLAGAPTDPVWAGDPAASRNRR